MLLRRLHFLWPLLLLLFHLLSPPCLKPRNEMEVTRWLNALETLEAWPRRSLQDQATKYDTHITQVTTLGNHTQENCMWTFCKFEEHLVFLEPSGNASYVQSKIWNSTNIHPQVELYSGTIWIRHFFRIQTPQFRPNWHLLGTADAGIHQDWHHIHRNHKTVFRPSFRVGWKNSMLGCMSAFYLRPSVQDLKYWLNICRLLWYISVSNLNYSKSLLHLFLLKQLQYSTQIHPWTKTCATL